MSYGWHDLLGNSGVFLILACYLLVQLDRIDTRSAGYSVINGLGVTL